MIITGYIFFFIMSLIICRTPTGIQMKCDMSEIIRKLDSQSKESFENTYVHIPRPVDFFTQRVSFQYWYTQNKAILSNLAWYIIRRLENHVMLHPDNMMDNVIIKWNHKAWYKAYVQIMYEHSSSALKHKTLPPVHINYKEHTCHDRTYEDNDKYYD